MALRKNLQWIGLTGGVASGKSKVAELIRRHGWPVIDADVEARLAVGPGSQGLVQVQQVFGAQVLRPDGELDRVKMAEIVFTKTDRLRQLEAIIHPIVQASVQKQKDQFSRQGLAFAVYEVPLLFEKSLQSQFAGTILVYCDPDIQLSRLMSRNSLTLAQAKLRVSSQLPTDDKKKLATWTIENNDRLNELALKVDSLLRVIESSCHDSAIE